MKNDFWLACLTLLVVIVPLLLAWLIVSLSDQSKSWGRMKDTDNK